MFRNNSGRPKCGRILSRRADPIGGAVWGLLRRSLVYGCIAYDRATMAQSRSRAALRTVLRIACDLLRLVSAAAVRSHAQLAAENLFLRKQLALYVGRQVKPRRADDATRIALVALSWLIDWRRIFTVVKPDTLIRWHRKGFQLFWRWKSMPCGRPRVPADLQRLIAQMAAANRTWGEERIASELLLKLGIRVSPRTVRRYMPRVPRLGVAGSRSCGARLCAITPTRCWHAISS